MNKRKVTAMVIGVSMLFSTIPVTFAATGTFPPLDLFASDKNANIQKEMIQPPNIAPPPAQSAGERKIIFEGVRRSINQNPREHDRYKITEKDIEELSNAGHSIYDILKADELGNTINLDPKQLLEEKKESQKSWEEIEKWAKQKKVAVRYSQLSEKYPEEAKVLASESFLEADKLVIFAAYDQYPNIKIQEIINIFKKDGYKGISNFLKENKSKKIPDEKLAKLGLTQADVEGMDENTLDANIEIVKRTGKPLKEFLKYYREYQKSKEAKFKGGVKN